MTVREMLDERSAEVVDGVRLEPQAKPCKYKCGAEVVLLPDHKGLIRAVDVNSWDGARKFKEGVHRRHTCAGKTAVRKNKKRHNKHGRRAATERQHERDNNGY